ncbi:DUF7537 family lipoprotein [Salinigranum salinum]|uniref:DUF7537 family lipoprotein n=1 Tax=Salinigranum salinum TaxID=1364937 RepID=UPI0012608D60|nr:hypothetical protein [Salinigranum salinum]
MAAVVAGLVVAAGGVAASGIVSQPLDHLMGSGGETDSGPIVGPDGTVGGDGGGDLPAEAFTPPVDQDVLLDAHAGRLDAAGSFTFEERYTFASDDFDALPANRTTTVTHDLDGDQVVVESVVGSGTATERYVAYRNGKEKYERRELQTGETEYATPERDLAPDALLEPFVLQEFGNVTLDHREGETGHVYTATGVDTLSDGAFSSGTQEIVGFELTATVTNRGLLRSYSFTIEYQQEDGRAYTLSGHAEFTAVGTTDVRAPTWLSEARESTT